MRAQGDEVVIGRIGRMTSKYFCLLPMVEGVPGCCLKHRARRTAGKAAGHEAGA
jgi:hypothetical protein